MCAVRTRAGPGLEGVDGDGGRASREVPCSPLKVEQRKEEKK